VILLDTNALIWLLHGHRRSRPLLRVSRLYLSPASVLEVQFLAESGRLRLAAGTTLASVMSDERWALDEPAAGRWFMAAAEVGWTRDPFDRLIAAHARVRGWRLATGDEVLIARLGPSGVVAL
jgi:PIN domain nuclease of toxin-antitoxin system